MAQRVVIPGFRKIETGGGGGETGTSNYNDLTNKPSVNNVPLSGNLNTADLHLTTQTLEDEGIPADSKIVGDKINEILNSLSAITSTLDNLEKEVSSLSANVNELSNSVSNTVVTGSDIGE